MRKGTVREAEGGEGYVCRCGCKFWYRTRVTLPERVALWAGWYETVELKSLLECKGPLGGPAKIVGQYDWKQAIENGRKVVPEEKEDDDSVS